MFWVIGGLVFVVAGLFMPSIVRMTFVMIGVIWTLVGLMLVWFSRGQSAPDDAGRPGAPPGSGGWVR